MGVGILGYRGGEDCISLSWGIGMYREVGCLPPLTLIPVRDESRFASTTPSGFTPPSGLPLLPAPCALSAPPPVGATRAGHCAPILLPPPSVTICWSLLLVRLISISYSHVLHCTYHCERARLWLPTCLYTCVQKMQCLGIWCKLRRSEAHAHAKREDCVSSLYVIS